MVIGVPFRHDLGKVGTKSFFCKAIFYDLGIIFIGYWAMAASIVTIVMSCSIAWQISIRSKGS